MMTMMDFEDVLSMVGTGWTVLADEDGEMIVVKACPPRQNPDADGWYLGKGETVSEAVVSLIDGLAACGWTVNRSTYARVNTLVRHIDEITARHYGRFIVNDPAMTALLDGES